MDYSRRIKQAVNLIKEAKSITAFTGAGVSTESGISDFRSPGGNGRWGRYIYHGKEAWPSVAEALKNKVLGCQSVKGS